MTYRAGRFTILTIAATIATVLPLQGQDANPDTTTFDKDGTAHLTRVIPVPKAVSPEMQALLARGQSLAPGPNDPVAKGNIELARKMYPVHEEDKTIAGVKTRLFTPPGVPPDKKNRILINLHGGGFVIDSGSLVESIPIASLTKTPVLTVYYRLATEAPFPAAVDDTIAVYKELLKTYKPENMALFGTSAGAVITAQVAVRLKRDALPLPAALGFFTGAADLSRAGDSQAFFGVPGLLGAAPPENQFPSVYLKGSDPRGPLVSPIFADLRGLPPTLNITGTRDMLLSGTANFHRALLKAGVKSELIVYDAMSHAFWYMIGTPESKEALEAMAEFFDRQLNAKAKH
jgi:epsilon-lactone hydrolase